MAGTGADLLVEGLLRHGVRHVFGMPGSHSTAIYDALARCGAISTTLARNEQAGTFMADGYARVSGVPGVVCTTAGPGATNALTGVAEAWADSVPLLLLAGQVNAADLDRECGNYHEIDLEAIFRPVTRWCGTVRRGEEIPAMVGQAFQAMTTGRPRPTALFLPQDVMRQPCAATAEVLGFARVSARRARGRNRQRGGARRCQTSDHPGRRRGGVGRGWRGNPSARPPAPLSGHHHAQWQGAARRARALVAWPRSIGAARAALPHADAMLAVGCRFTEVLTDWRRMPVPRTLVQIDLDPHQIGMNYPVMVGIVADARASLAAIRKQLQGQAAAGGWGDLLDQARAARHPQPEWLIETLRAELPEATPVFTDACEIGYRMQADWSSYGPRQFFYPSNYIALGWAFPAALGAAEALAGQPVLSMSGDGGFLMTAQELATAVRSKLPVIAVVHNDGAYGAIKNIQQRAFQGRYLDVDLNNPDFLSLAAAFGVPGHRARTPGELRAAVSRALQQGGPCLIEVPDRWRFLRDLAVPNPAT